MLFTDLMIFKTQQVELHRQAAKYRLVRSLEKPPQGLERIYATLGNALISLGQVLIKRTQAAH